ncbi:MAG TPA: hypothetical protein VGC21_13660 [Telluria sp.]
MKIYAVGDSALMRPVGPLLFNPVIVAVNGDRMLFEGLERQGDGGDPKGAVYMQEWAVQVMEKLPE